MKITKIEKLKKGDYFKFSHRKEAKVYVFDGYCRFSKKYSFYMFDDISRFGNRGKGTEIYIEFEF